MKKRSPRRLCEICALIFAEASANRGGIQMKEKRLCLFVLLTLLVLSVAQPMGAAEKPLITKPATIAPEAKMLSGR